MPIVVPANCVRVSWNFDLVRAGAKVDVAEFSVNGRLLDAFGAEPGSPPTDAQYEAACGALAQGAYAAWHDHATQANYAVSVVLADVRVAQNDAAGHTISEARYNPLPTPLWAGTDNHSLPWQLSVCIGAYNYAPGTFAPNSRNRRGRVFLPPMSTVVLGEGSTGQLSADTLAQILHEWDQIMTATHDTSLAPLSGLAWTPGILSPTKHQWYDTITWASDSIIDTQRRRRNRELGLSASIPVFST